MNFLGVRGVRAPRWHLLPLVGRSLRLRPILLLPRPLLLIVDAAQADAPNTTADAPGGKDAPAVGEDYTAAPVDAGN